MDSALTTIFAFGVILAASALVARGGLYGYETLSESWSAAEQRSEERINSDIRVTSITSDGFEWDVSVRNDGRTPIIDFSALDLVVHYSSGADDYITWLPFATTLQANGWTVASIQGDGVEQGVVNQGETAQLEVCLDPAPANATVNWLQVTTEAGISSASSFTGVPVLGRCDFCDPGDTGWLNATAEAAATGGDGNGFETDPTGAFADGGAFATNADGPGDRHLYHDYALDVSSQCAIAGIEVRLDWWLPLTLDTNSMSVELSWDGGTTWTSAQTDTVESTSEHTVVLGGPTDTWGHAWTPAELLDSAFRVRVTSNCTGLTCAIQDFFLDWVPVKVYVEPG
jgi:hypothetical protein